MYLTNIKALVRQLKTNTLSEYDKLSYLLLMLVVSGLGTLSNVYNTMTKSGIYKEIPGTTWGQQFIKLSVHQVMLIAILIIAALLCYYVNKKGDNKRFLERFMCLIVPAYILNFLYIMLFTLAIVLPIGVMLSLFYSFDPSAAIAKATPLIELAIALNFWRLMYTNMKEVAGSPKIT